MTTLRTVAVVGGSLAGLRAMEALRRQGYEGKIVWIGAELETPYSRPPLSKQILDGTWTAERAYFRKDESLETPSTEISFGRRAIALRPNDRNLVLDDGVVLTYDALVIATGARARELGVEGSALENIYTLRTLSDALSIRKALEARPRVVLIGAGFIGLEVAAAARKRGLDVTVVDPLTAPLVRALGARIGKKIEDFHRNEGVVFRWRCSPEHFEGHERVERVVLNDGSALDADLVVVGIGAVPETAWLSGSGIEINDGVLCNTHCATNYANVVAAGDVARWTNPLFGASMRVEHWTNAAEQAHAAVARLLGGAAQTAPYAPVPYFWSDQYTMKLQFAGHYLPSDQLHILEDDPEARRLTALYERRGRLTAALALNRPALLNRYRALIAQGAPLAEALEYDPAGGGKR